MSRDAILNLDMFAIFPLPFIALIKTLCLPCARHMDRLSDSVYVVEGENR